MRWIASSALLISCAMSSSSMRAIDTAACTAADILPGIPDTIRTLTDRTQPDIALKIITGIVQAGGAAAKAYACYLRSAALTNMSGGNGTGEDDNKKYVAPINMVSGRAASCELMADKCDHQLRSAWLLFYLNKQGQVKL